MIYHPNLYGAGLGAGLGDARADLVSVLATFMGEAKAEAWVRSLETLIKSKAEQGAKAAIPTIKTEVKKTVQPLIIAALAAGGLGLLFGVIALRRSRRRS